jgi:hypothetical protein
MDLDPNGSLDPGRHVFFWRAGGFFWKYSMEVFVLKKFNKNTSNFSALLLSILVSF